MRKAAALIAAALAALTLATSASANGRSGQWMVIAAPVICPPPLLCKRWFYTEPNYGLALKLARALQTQGFQVTVEPAWTPSGQATTLS